MSNINNKNLIGFWDDPTFYNIILREKKLQPLANYFTQENLTIMNEQKLDQFDDICSSYVDNNYKFLFYSFVKMIKPRKCVELGVLNGYSLFSMAMALRDNGFGKITGCDLFEDYHYKHQKYDMVKSQVKAYNLNNQITLKKGNAFESSKLFNSIDLLHVDISNNGETLKQVFNQWADKVKKVMLFEGGSRERDNVDWMIKYKKPKISNTLAYIEAYYPEWSIYVIEPYPSLTILIRESLFNESH